MESISECSYSLRPFKWYDMPKSKLKISWRRGKQYTSLVTLGGRHNKKHEMSDSSHSNKFRD